MFDINYCKKCVQPDTRPGIFLNESGICSGCVGHEEKYKKIDWNSRKKELDEIIDKFRKRGAGYDCIIPVSGGKDSTYQVYIMKKIYGMNPLAVTYRYGDRTALGQKNLDNLRNMGVDHIEISPRPDAEKKFLKKAFFEAGDPCLVDHMGIFAVTLRMAVNYKIPLIVWGESTAMEYGGTAGDRQLPYLNKQWCLKYGCLQGKAPEDWIGEELTADDMLVYMIPEDAELAGAKISSIFLGYYLPWDPLENFKTAAAAGFEKSSDGPKLGLYDFADLDSTNIVVHHYIKWFKFGMTRLFDNISVEIRNGRMTRAEGINILREKSEKTPEHEIKLFCAQIGITVEQFWLGLEKFRNLNIWKKDASGSWHIPGYLEGM